MESNDSHEIPDIRCPQPPFRGWGGREGMVSEGEGEKDRMVGEGEKERMVRGGEGEKERMV